MSSTPTSSSLKYSAHVVVTSNPFPKENLMTRTVCDFCKKDSNVLLRFQETPLSSRYLSRMNYTYPNKYTSKEVCLDCIELMFESIPIIKE